MKIISYGKTQHECKLPGRWKSHKLGIQYGAIIECDCGRQWHLDRWENERYWRPIFTSRLNTNNPYRDCIEGCTKHPTCSDES